MRDFCGEEKRMRFERMQIAVPKKRINTRSPHRNSCAILRQSRKNAAIRIKKSFELSGGFLGDKAVCY